MSYQPPENMKPGDWICGCGELNFKSRDACRQCGGARGNMNPHNYNTEQNFVFQQPNTQLQFNNLQNNSFQQVNNQKINIKPGDWNCGCGELNFRSRDACRKCGAPRGNLQFNNQQNTNQQFNNEMNNQQVNIKSGDWNCGCGELNFKSRDACRKCGASRVNGYNQNNDSFQQNNSFQQPSTNLEFNNQQNTNQQFNNELNNQQVNIKPGDWNCGCGELNFKSRDACRKCGARRVNGYNQNNDSFQQTNNSQQFNNELNNQQINTKPGDWNCGCGELNFKSRDACRKCGASRVNLQFNNQQNTNLEFNNQYNDGFQQSTNQQFNNSNSGDWNCGCGELNFKSRDACRKCGTHRVNGYNQNNDGFQQNTSQQFNNELKNHQLNTKPGDWNCGCGELNFKSRDACRKCGASRNSCF